MLNHYCIIHNLSVCVSCLDSIVDALTPSIQGNPPGGRCSPSVARKICPVIGDVVTITCDTSYADSYVISGPNQRMSISTPLIFTTTSSDAGTYTCVSINNCRNDTETATLELCKFFTLTIKIFLIWLFRST